MASGVEHYDKDGNPLPEIDPISASMPSGVEHMAVSSGESLLHLSDLRFDALGR